MNLIIIKADKNYYEESKRIRYSNGLIKLNGEYLVERIIRVGQVNGIKRVFCIINSRDQELENYITTNNFSIPIKIFTPSLQNSMHILFALASIHNKDPFFIVNANSVFLEDEFSEFVTYSILQEEADGAIAVTRSINDANPLGVAMNDEDTILKFNDSKDGYSWFNGGIYYFPPRTLTKTKYAFLSGKSQLEQFLNQLIIDGYILKGFSFTKIIKVENEIDIINAEDMINQSV